MKTLIQKELRENFKVAVIAFAALVVMVLLSLSRYASDLAQFPPQGYGMEGEKLQPLIHSGFLTTFALMCGVLGALLGWMQIHHERHRDLWAYLVHRPISRGDIFLGKVISGIALYLAAAGIPLLGFIIWVRIPGHVAAPFEWSMAVPAVGHLFAGIAYYFAGMLTSLRQARWYASRALGLGVAFMMSVAVTTLSAPGGILFLYKMLSLGAAILGGASLITATWSAFQSNGYFEGQPKIGQAALTLSVTFGAMVVLVAASGLIMPMIMRASIQGSWTSYTITKDGTLYKEVATSGRPQEIQQLDGKPVLDPKTGRPIDLQVFMRQTAPWYQINVSTNQQPYRFEQKWFTFWRVKPETLWYYWHGRLAAYDANTRLLKGTLGPNGFEPGLPSREKFLTDKTEPYFWSFYPPQQGYSTWQFQARTLPHRTTLYEVDLDNATTRTLFTTTPDDPILGAKDVSLDGVSWDYTVFATRQFIYVITPDGKVAAKTDFKPGPPDYADVKVSFLEPSGQFAVWLAPSYLVPDRAKLPTYLTVFSKEAGLVKRTEMPTRDYVRDPQTIEQVLLSLLAPPVATGFAFIRVGFEKQMLQLFGTSLAAACLLCVPIGLVFGRRYNLSGVSQTSWAIFHALFGLPGLVAFFSVNEWPARERCPKCGKLRVVARENCEYCDAEFPPPEKTGAEIFEPLAGK